MKNQYRGGGGGILPKKGGLDSLLTPMHTMSYPKII